MRVVRVKQMNAQHAMILAALVACLNSDLPSCFFLFIPSSACYIVRLSCSHVRATRHRDLFLCLEPLLRLLVVIVDWEPHNRSAGDSPGDRVRASQTKGVYGSFMADLGRCPTATASPLDCVRRRIFHNIATVAGRPELSLSSPSAALASSCPC
jgi:hypothetical protein